MWIKIVEVVLAFLSTFLNGLIDARAKTKKVEDLGREKEKVDSLQKASIRSDAAKKELEKPILQGNELIEDLRRKNKSSNTHSNSSK